MKQFQTKMYISQGIRILHREQIDAIFTEAAIHHDMIVHTIVTPDLREYISDLARTKHVRALDMIGPALTAFSNYFEQEPKAEPGLLHAVNDEYFGRVAAMEFTLNHDDGRNPDSLHLADVILVGISRTSKTPLSLFLSMNGLKVVNVPLVQGTALPKNLFSVDQRKIIGLTIDPEALLEIRRNRLSRLGAQDHAGDYATQSKVMEELEWANNIFKENKRWPVFNVTDKALEEVAADILKLLNLQK